MRPKSDLRQYQVRVLQELYEHDERLVAIRMGGGKTVAALSAIRELIDDGVIHHALVIAPKRVAALTWPAEIEGWDHTRELRYAVVAGSPEQRARILENAACRDITLIGIDLIPWLLEQLEGLPDDHPVWHLLVIDEVSKLRDPTGVRSKRMAKMVKRWKITWGMSGTLRPNSALDLFMPAKIALKAKSPWQGSFYKWQRDNFRATDWNGYNWEPLYGAEERLNAELAPFVTTLAENEMPQLPALSIIFDPIELPPPARHQYREMEKQLMTGNVVAANAAVAVGKLGQICNGFVYQNDGKAVRIHNEKTEWLRDIIENAVEPLMVVYEYKEDLRVIRELLGEDVPTLGDKVTDKESERILRDWNDRKLPFLACHPGAAGHGINAQAGGADQIWISPCWSPELWAQTIARLHRSGQTRPVFVRVCQALYTVDGMKIDRVHHKMTGEAAFEKYLREHHYNGG